MTVRKREFLKELENQYGDRYVLLGEYKGYTVNTLFQDKNEISKYKIWQNPRNIISGNFSSKDYYSEEEINIIIKDIEDKKANIIKRAPRDINKKPNKGAKTHEQFVKEIEEKFPNQYNIIGTYTTCNAKILVEHKCEHTEHYQWLISPNNLLNHKRSCPRCNNKERGHEAFERKVFDLVDDEYKLIGEYVTNLTNVILEHNIEGCHHRFPITPSDFLYHEGRCPKCTGISRAETYISDILKEYSINNKPQYRFEDCVFKSPLRFDFAVFKDEDQTVLLFLIEYQGEQHYSPQRFNGISIEKATKTFEETVIKDKIKVDYCKDNNIPLFKITYKEKSNLKEVLLKELIKYKLIVDKINS